MNFGAKTRRNVARFLLTLFLAEIAFPYVSLALTSGPSQPEAGGFEPIGTSDMVDMFSGDFTYNIPLMDIDGYPINISYNSGVGMDDEASWVGLGWSLNVGSINRSMRGIPDEFDGTDKIEKWTSMKPNKTFGVTGNTSFEIFGFKDSIIAQGFQIKLNVGATLGITYNNYTGISVEKSITPSFSAGKGNLGINTSFGLSSSTDDGLNVTPSVGFSKRFKANDNAENKLGFQIGSSFNSREGLKQLSLTGSLSRSYEKVHKDDGGKSQEIQGKVGGAYSIANAAASWSLGQPTYTAGASLPMENLSITANFTTGLEFFGAHQNFNFQGYYSEQRLQTNYVASPAFGYMHNDKGKSQYNAILDFNRENDGGFTENTPNLSLAQPTFDLYAVSGQGTGGSFRPMRNDIGYVFDPQNQSVSNGFSIGAEIGTANLAHLGGDFSAVLNFTNSNPWFYGNGLVSKLGAVSTGPSPLYEKVYFREANEKTIDVSSNRKTLTGNTAPVHAELNPVAKFQTEATGRLAHNGGAYPLSGPVYQADRSPRTSLFTILTRKELDAGLGIENVHPNAYPAPSHHPAEVTTTGNDGRRYVYGIAAYNHFQDEVSFAVGKRLNGTGGHSVDCNTGYVTYAQGEDSEENDLGLDSYFSKTRTPGYAHSYLLTCILSPDYIDADNVKGPSIGDLGSYVHFHYSRNSAQPYKWRTPMSASLYQANLNEGLQSDPHDDKANYVYGEKELWYLDKIETKNYIAIFELEDRKDALGAQGPEGGVSTSQRQKYLKKISLYSAIDYRQNGANAIPLKEVHFEYDYSLCPNVPNNDGTAQVVNGVDINQNKGKLTLRKIYFTYQGSQKGRKNAYRFDYSNVNPEYNIKAYDRWGCYKPVNGNSPACASPLSPLTNSEFSYAEQNKAVADQSIKAWHLEKIHLPSGGTIQVEYESDDYAYVQNRQAMRMVAVNGVSTGSNPTVVNSPTLLNIDDENTQLYFDPIGDFHNINDYVDIGSIVAFRFLMRLRNNDYEYVPGYAEIDHGGYDAATQKMFVRFKRVKLQDNGANYYNPITKAAIQYGRLNMPRRVWDQPTIDDSNGFSLQLLTSLFTYAIGQDLFNIYSAVRGPNATLYDLNVGKQAVITKSFLRVKDPSRKKLGGGARVKRILMNDEWSGMTGGAEGSFQYGQEYSYVTEDGISSGVATYEPQMGGEENPFKQPVFFDKEKLLAPDDRFYQEEPFGESLFPSPSVGYSRVVVKNLQYQNVKRHATGHVVHEFYTAKDFPVIVTKTPVVYERHETSPFSLNSILNKTKRDHMTATQGFAVELNDMHGKPSKQMVYQEGKTTPITSVEYRYQSEPYLGSSHRLTNQARIVLPNGQTQTAEIGVFFDMLADFRQERNTSSSMAIEGNFDAFLIGALPAAVPTFWPNISESETQFRSITTTKIIQRFGLLETVVARDLGSQVNTNNLAYDSQTGEVLLTQTTTNFEDKIYSMNYPAYWHYDRMGMASKNIGVRLNAVNFNSNGTANLAQADRYLVKGDEISVDDGFVAWVTNVTPHSVTIMDKFGAPVSGIRSIKVLRSGRKNLMGASMASLTGLDDPSDNFLNNNYEKVLQAAAMEFTEYWRTYCDCYSGNYANLVPTTNPYVQGVLGNYRMKTSYLHLSGRTQSNYNNNLNIRKDGVFTSYTPYYKNQGGKWLVDGKNWTFTSTISEFSPYGQELENRDALGRYSAATFGYNQTLATSVAANAQYREIGSDNFEDYDYNPCSDRHFKFETGPGQITSGGHTGRNAVRVSAGNPVVMNKQLAACDPAGCKIAFQTNTDGNVMFISLSNAQAPVALDWEWISGNPVYDFANGGIQITGTGYQLRVEATDANGCKITQIFTR